MTQQDFAQIEVMFSIILEELSGNLSNSEFAEVQDFLDHGEYGVAFETLCSNMAEDGKQVNDDFTTKAQELADFMDMPTDALFRLIPPK